MKFRKHQKLSNTEDKVRVLFEKYGEIEVYDAEALHSRSFVFIKYKDLPSVKKALTFTYEGVYVVERESRNRVKLLERKERFGFGYNVDKAEIEDEVEEFRAHYNRRRGYDEQEGNESDGEVSGGEEDEKVQVEETIPDNGEWE